MQLHMSDTKSEGTQADNYLLAFKYCTVSSQSLRVEKQVYVHCSFVYDAHLQNIYRGHSKDRSC